MEQKINKALIEKEKKLICSLTDFEDASKITFTDFGWTSRVYLINDGEIVFKFPRTEKVKVEYELEKKAYRLAYDLNDDVKISEIKWEHPSNDYLGYRGIIGEPLSDVIESLTVEAKETIGKKLGSFLKKLHQRNISDAPKITLDKEVAEFLYKFELGLETIQKNFSEEETEVIKGLIKFEYPKIMGSGSGLNVLCHGDLGYWNMIYGPSGELGIIDFGDVGYYDSSIDFAGLTDDEVLQSAFKAYGDNSLKDKVKIRQRVMPILDLPFFLGKNDDVGVQKTLLRIRNSLGESGSD